MTKKKIIFSILSLIIVITCSIGVFSCYRVVENRQNEIHFNDTTILYDIFSIVYPVSYELKDGVDSDKLSQYITANQTATDMFYQNAIADGQLALPEKRNIKYYAESDSRITGNTSDALSNISNDQELQDKYQWYIRLSFDENGSLTYDSLGCDETSNQNYELIWNNYKQSSFNYLDEYDVNWQLANPTNFTIYIAVPTNIVANSNDYLADYATYYLEIANIFPFAFIAGLIVVLYTLIYPYTVEKEVGALKYPAKIKLEPLFILAAIVYTGIIVIIYGLIVDYSNGYFIDKLNAIGFNQYSGLIVAMMNVIAWSALLLLILFTTYYFKSYFKEGLINSLKNNTVCAWIIKWIKRLIDKAADFDFNNEVNKTILKIVIVNAIIVSIICCFFTFGIFFTLIYSIIIFWILKTKFQQFQNDYQVLLNAVKRLSNGDFDVEIHQDIGIFNTLGHEFTNVKNGFEKAVNEEVKSQKMKTELISNVSHDLKTPLTSIITYIDLLKNNDLDQNQQQEYLNTLDRNALRLKKLIDDLFEVAKVNSGDINLHLVPVDIVALIQQAKFELDDQFKAKQLTFKTNYPNEKITLLLDSSKTYRIFQNLLINISKYALENTRVYLDVIKRDNQVIITFKNISADEIKISEAKLVERFVQGDTSRNTSGSGLGLSIAKSFTEIQHGTFTINVDGDLFKATVIFNLDK